MLEGYFNARLPFHTFGSLVTRMYLPFVSYKMIFTPTVT